MAELPTTEAILAALRKPSKTVKFTLCGYDFDVPELTLDLLEKVENELAAIVPGMSNYAYGRAVGELVAKLFDLPLGCFNQMTLPEMRNLFPAMNELLRISGFEMGEAEAAVETGENPGTGTLTPSPLNLPPKESAVETSGGSSAPTASEPTDS